MDEEAHMHKPIVGVASDVGELAGRRRLSCSTTYIDSIVRAGGVPIVLAPTDDVAAQVAQCDAIVLPGGDDPRTEPYGSQTHPKATPVDPTRQRYEEVLLEHLAGAVPNLPVLGVCLGMQMMGLRAGAELDQHMPETCDPDGRHWDGIHEVEVHALLGSSGPVFSRHRQCLRDAGALDVIAVADDGVIEGIADHARRFYVGVQWHPERTEGGLGAAPFELMVDAARHAVA